jgi:type I restriction enzyme S subunit
MLEGFQIPLPPLAIQTRIVEILDHFTNLTANLTAELNLRRKQFEHYREKLLSLDGVEGVEWKKLGEVISDLRTGLNPRIHFKLNTDDAQNYYITVRELKGFDFEVDEKTDRINNSAVLRINERSKLKIGDILFSGTGTIGRTALIKRLPTNYNIKEGVYAITPKPNIIDSKYLIYLLHTDLIMDVINSKSGGSTVRSIPMAELKNIPLPIPSLKTQHSIVSILDKFTALIENIEKELALRQKQYEYYREELLRFGG